MRLPKVWVCIALWSSACASGTSTEKREDMGSVVGDDDPASSDGSTSTDEMATPAPSEPDGQAVPQPDSMPDGQMPSMPGAMRATSVVPQLTAGGTGTSPRYQLSVRVGAPAPYGSGRGSAHVISIGSDLGR